MTPKTNLLRQIHPSFVQNGRVTSQAFRPTPKDGSHLSTYDGDRVSAADSWTHFTGQENCRSCGVMAVTNAECVGQSLAVIPDGLLFPEHVSVDFSAYEKTDIEKKAKVLSRMAHARGWLHQEDALF
jgi:hypothetical protein